MKTVRDRTATIQDGHLPCGTELCFSSMFVQIHRYQRAEYDKCNMTQLLMSHLRFLIRYGQPLHYRILFPEAGLSRNMAGEWVSRESRLSNKEISQNGTPLQGPDSVSMCVLSFSVRAMKCLLTVHSRVADMMMLGVTVF